ncbi:MAG TPA: hypothetical protein VKR26_17795 [Terriglobales bacterium]|nr:hypothetical protein [Terriglobales bacterium]
MTTGSHTASPHLAVVRPTPSVSPPPGSPWWFRALMPSIADVIFLLLLLALTYGGLQQRLLGDAGTGWHIRAGQQMLATHAIPRQDSFSYTMPGHPWFAWEWLYDLAAGIIYSRMGLNGVVFLSALLIAGTFAGLFRKAVARNRYPLIAAVLVVLAIFASSIHFLARPHLFTWVFTLIFWNILESATAPGSTRTLRRLYWLPALMLLWVNLHGGFLVGLALVGLYFLGALWETLAAHEPSGRATAKIAARRLGMVGLLAGVATFFNPYGYGLWLHIHAYLGSRFYMNNIQEFLSPNFHGAAEKFFAALLLLSLLGLAVNRSHLRASHLLVILFSVYFGLYAARNIPIASILLVLSVTPLLAGAVERAGSAEELAPRARNLFLRWKNFAARMARTELGLRGHLLPLAAVVITFVVCLQGGRLGARPLVRAHFDGKRFPVAAADFLAARGIRSQVFNPDYWGGYLIYRLGPGYKVFMDDRHDFYGEPFVRDYIKLKDIQPGWQEVLDKQKVNWVLIPPEWTLSNALKELPQWRVLYDDHRAILFARVKPLP